MIALHSVQQVTPACRGWCAEHDEATDGLIHLSGRIEWWGETAAITSVRLRRHEQPDALGATVIELDRDGDVTEVPMSDARTLADALNELITATAEPA